MLKQNAAPWIASFLTSFWAQKKPSTVDSPLSLIAAPGTFSSKQGFGTIGKALLTLFGSMLGEFDFEAFQAEYDTPDEEDSCGGDS